MGGKGEEGSEKRRLGVLSSPLNKDLEAFKIKVGVKVIFPTLHSGYLGDAT